MAWEPRPVDRFTAETGRDGAGVMRWMQAWWRSAVDGFACELCVLLGWLANDD